MIPVKRLLSVGVMSLFKLLSSSRNNNNKEAADLMNMS